MKERGVIMNKELFVKTINQMEELHNEEEKFNGVLKVIDPEFGGGYIHNKTINMLENLLKELVNDQYDYIGYYLWELNFGHDYEDGMITSETGENIRLSNPEELYNLIAEENKD